MAKGSETSDKTSPHGSVKPFPKLSKTDLADALNNVREMYQNGELRPATSEGPAIVPAPKITATE